MSIIKTVEDWSKYRNITQDNYIKPSPYTLLGIAHEMNYNSFSDYVNGQNVSHYPQSTNTVYYHGETEDVYEDRLKGEVETLNKRLLEANNLREKAEKALKDVEVTHVEKDEYLEKVRGLENKNYELSQSLEKEKKKVNAFKDAIGFNETFYTHLRDDDESAG
jgi:hypothetical protein